MSILKKAYNKVISLFKGNNAGYIADTDASAGIVRRNQTDRSIVNDLTHEITAINNSYNKHISDIKHKYNDVAESYNKAYDEFEIISNQYQHRMVDKDTYEEHEKQLHELDASVRDVGAELDTAEQYKREEIEARIKGITALEGDYITSVADTIHQRKVAIEKAKNDYLNSILIMHNTRDEVESVDRLLKHQHQQFNIPYAGTMLKRFDMHVDMLNLDSFELDSHEIKNYIEVRTPTH